MSRPKHWMRTRRRAWQQLRAVRNVVDGMRAMASAAEKAAAGMQDVGAAILAVKETLPRLRGEGFSE